MRTEKHFITQSPKNGAKRYGLGTAVKAYFFYAVHNTAMAINSQRKNIDL